MTKNNNEMTTPDALRALVAYLDKDAPETKAEARKLTNRPTAALAELVDWAGELADAVTEAVDAVEAAKDADAEDREDFHGTAQEAVETVLIILERTGFTRPEPEV